MPEARCSHNSRIPIKIAAVGIADGFGIVINPRPEGYGSRFVVHSFCPPRYKEQRSLLRAS